MPVWACISFGCNCVSLSCLLSYGWFYSLMAVDYGQLSLKWLWVGLGLQGSLHGPGAVSFHFSLEASSLMPSLSLLTFVLCLSYFLCSPTFALSVFDFCMGGVFTEWEYWKSAQLWARVRPMAERPTWPCDSVYRETARVERTISLLDFLTAPATVSNRKSWNWPLYSRKCLLYWLPWHLVVETGSLNLKKPNSKSKYYPWWMWRQVKTRQWCCSSTPTNYENSHAGCSKIQNTVITGHSLQYRMNRPLWRTSWKYWSHSDMGPCGC